MDNIPPSNAPSDQHKNVSNLPFTVLLSDAQYASYKTASLEILAPDSEYLESIGRSVQNDATEKSLFQLHNQVVLLEYLCCNISQDIELPARAFCK